MALPPAIRSLVPRPVYEFFGGEISPAAIMAPIREGSPESKDAKPELGRVVSRSGDASFLPSGWMGQIATNDDRILARDGTGLALYEALLSDDTAFSCLQQRRLAITSRDWEVAPGNPDDPRSVKAADDFRAMLKDVGFDRVTGLLHFGVWFGYAVAEGVYEMRPHDGRTIVWLSDVVVPDRRWFGFTNAGELRYVEGIGYALGEAVPDNKFLTIRTGGTHDFAFYGMGLAHWAYWPIFFKRAALKFWSLYLEKLGIPTVAIEFNEQQNNTAEKAKLLQAGVAVGQDRAVLFPDGMVSGEKVKLLEATRSAPASSSYSEFVDESNEGIMRVILGSPGTAKATPGGLGGDGQARKDEGVKAELVKADSDMISEGLNRTFARWITRWNHGPDVAPPTVYRVLDDAEDLSAVATRDVQLDGIGIKRTEDSVREVYGDGYEVDRLSTEQQAAREDALAAAKAGTVVAAGIAANDDTPDDPATLAFTAMDEQAIDRLVAALVDEGNPVFEAMGEQLRDGLQGVTTIEGARVALLEAWEKLPVERLAKLTALPMLAERAGAVIGAEDEVTA